MENTEFIEANRAAWDGRVDSHLIAYQAEVFADDPAGISPIVERDLELMRGYLPPGSPIGSTLMHLQCHIGTDTLSWARLGATVTGVDFSGAAIAAARSLADRAGLAATFVEATIDDAPDVVSEQFDIVYTGTGAINWLPDLEAWASAIWRLLKPGGTFFIRDGHPMLYTLDYDRADDLLSVTHPYFGGSTPQRSDDGITYATAEVATAKATTYEWPHSISEILEPLLRVGLRLDSFQEQRDLPWRSLPQMVSSAAGFVLPAGRERLPQSFSILASKPR